jgi:general secretion pathway protein G
MRRPRRSHGFTLLELVVVITVIGILVAAVAPSVMQRMVDDRVLGTRAEAEAILEAMVGDTATNSFGFVGDIGRLPVSLTELTVIGSLPAYTTATTRNIGMGWRGPYINAGTSANDYLTDAFGRAYTFAAGQVRSAGVDGVANNADDIVYPPAPPGVTGDVTVTVKTIQGSKTIVDPTGYRVDLYFSNGGGQASLSDAAGPYSFTGVPMGFHAVLVVKTSNPQAGTVVAQDTIVVRANGTAAAELWF